MTSVTETTLPGGTPGFNGADWSKYMAYRPIYPASFFKRIYEYHSVKPQAGWSTAHDVGAGVGIVAASLAASFNNVIVSDPNDGYTTLARKILVEDSGIPESKFTFFQEGAEKSAAESGTVDLIAACEMIQWTDIDAAMEEFDRELRVGGTVAVTSYTRPRIMGNERAQRIWQAIFTEYAKRTRGLGHLYDRAFETINSGLENVEFPEARWEAVKRIYINSGGSLEVFQIDDRVGESRVKKGEEKVWEEGDEDWSDIKDIDWFKAYLATWSARIPETEIQSLWDEMEISLKGERARIETPIVLVFATKKA
ncbi:uncharacterized protein BCR38DRAFT_422108 [Pseudomassariella vexata]|uniref:Methyltransferase type 11 domain-containing protein n=1 Tax=Pseudomassariella vexata TaxID=1141098 RepID=A0A1Y2EI05_9PEZI|nr:uncharacterized protein BCR38DRAFT_422108 [Pseudomassariella vexata]ORY70425.1 hypothetical protein BCR38DRAFT_422108 [Pseudomassariella vexata]